MRIIPAIDLIDGKCVRLQKGDYNKKTIYNENPVEVAKSFEAAGIEYLHLVDLDGAKAGEIINYSILEDIVSQTSLKVDFGGGVRSREDVARILESGGRQAVIGSMAFKKPDIYFEILNEFGGEKIVLGADARYGKIALTGWLEETDIDVVDAIRMYSEKGTIYVLSTDIEKDGMLEGPATELYQRIIHQEPRVRLIASGGVSGIGDLPPLRDMGCEGVIIGKAIYEGKIALEELQSWISYE
ncbi:1-(5-phosphoribosyl)-5-[(5-phosphoribosylamino)methylideneamino]imidazole-4-carboxamide isomerase [Membranihabitans maritimus]|uniref:1-(5-phosphoribosyl)-5-[(5- phosphoribosylamino)methylideneamino]imidazole-4- carboxamide isomerase n=1 Tax=Membranihabitans maritimus TaxID=2904244 RepID=UPI001EFFCCE4|nr:1-(5-phosphoribosyl)-5-[(5-phosphoribosylamino)methylideneamino]imidazole-4-carboxamide isomerase [Membranihabitans maritimus]